MEIQRAISQGANWSLKLSHVPALLALIDEQQIPVDIRLVQGANVVSRHTGTVYCRRDGNVLMLEAANTAIRIELDQLQEARAVSRAAGTSRRISLQLLGGSSTVSLTITGPARGAGVAGQIWQTVMDSLLIDSTRSLAHKKVESPVLSIPQVAEVTHRPALKTLRDRTGVYFRDPFSEMHLAFGAIEV